MATVLNIADELKKLTVLTGRTETTSAQEEESAFGNLGKYRDGAVFTGSFSGRSPWEKHPADEMVQVVDGRTELTILDGDGEQPLTLTAGALVIVPANIWHRFNAPDGVSLLTITPQPTEHSDAADPRVSA